MKWIADPVNADPMITGICGIYGCSVKICILEGWLTWM